MPLEVPSDGDLAIHSLLCDPQDNIERPSAFLYRAVVSSFYNREKSVWKEGIKKNGEEIENTEGIITETQLYGVLADALFHRERAEAIFNLLKSGPHFQRALNLWNWSVDEGDGSMTGKEFSSSTQLIGVLCEARFDSAGARRRHEELKGMPFYDMDKKQWMGFVGLNRRGVLVVEDDKCYCDAQLLGVCAELLFNPQEAKESFERCSNLRESAGERRWQFATHTDGTISGADDRECTADNQLLGVHCEGLIDYASGRRVFLQLKDGSLHDVVRKQWKNSSSDSDRMTSAQNCSS